MSEAGFAGFCGFSGLPQHLSDAGDAIRSACIDRPLHFFTQPSPLAPFRLSSKRRWLAAGTLLDRRTAAKKAHRSSGVVLRGALRGESPRTREGRRPDRQKTRNEG